MLAGMIAVRREQSAGTLAIPAARDSCMASCRESSYFSARESHGDDHDEHDDDDDDGNNGGGGGGTQRMGVSVLPASALTGAQLRKVAVGPAINGSVAAPRPRPVSPTAPAVGGGAAAAAAKAYEAALLAEAEKMRQEHEKVQAKRPSKDIARRFGAQRAAAASAAEEEPTGQYHEGDYVLIGDRELGVLVKVNPDGRIKAQLSDGTAKWRHVDDLQSVFGTRGGAAKPPAELDAGDWIRLRDKAGKTPTAKLPVGQLVKRDGARMQVRTTDGKTFWRTLEDLVPPSADAPKTGVVIGPHGEMLDPDWSAEVEAEALEAQAAAEMAAVALDAHRGAMQRLRRAMSSCDDIDDETSDEDSEGEGGEEGDGAAAPRRTMTMPAKSSSSSGEGLARWGRAAKQVRMQQRVVAAFNPGAYRRTVQRGGDIPAAIPTAADALVAPPPRPASSKLPAGMPPPPAAMHMARVPSKVLAAPKPRPSQMPPPPPGMMMGRVPSKVMAPPRLPHDISDISDNPNAASTADPALLQQLHTMLVAGFLLPSPPPPLDSN